MLLEPRRIATAASAPSGRLGTHRRFRAQQRQRIVSAFAAVYAVMQMRRRAAGVAAVADAAQQISGVDHAAGAQAVGPILQMGVVMAFERRAARRP